MHKFGSTGIVTGYIKQLLATFNLPKTHIYTKEHERYYEEHNIESPYILESFDDLNTIIPDPSRVLYTEYPTVAQKIAEHAEQTKASIEAQLAAFEEYLAGQILPDPLELEKKRQETEQVIKNLIKADAEYAAELQQDAIKSTNTIRLKKVVEDKYVAVTLDQVLTKCYVPYIKDGRIQFLRGGYYTSDAEFVPGTWQSEELDVNKSGGGHWFTYDRGKQYLNLTKRLQIKNNIYDSYTHEYLGDYLRFIRDFDGINLMPLYNCFSNRICPSGNQIAITRADGAEVIFDTSDDQYKIYMLPVKLFKNYTIAIDSNAPIEFSCGCFSLTTATKDIVNREAFEQLLSKTYFKRASTKFNQPFLYTALTDLAPKPLSQFPTYDELAAHAAARKFLAQIAPRESELKLFIKVPKEVTSSIVILEGDYTSWGDQAVSHGMLKLTAADCTKLGDTYLDTNKEDGQQHLLMLEGFSEDGLPSFKDLGLVDISPKLTLNYNHTVLTNEVIFSDLDLNLITPLQLLRINTQTQIPFADRLLEYLTDSCITGGDSEVRENVLMAQILASQRYKGKSEKGDYCTKNVITTQGDSLQINTTVFSLKADPQECTNLGDIYLHTVTHQTLPTNPYCRQGHCKHVMRLDNVISRSFTDLGPVQEFLPGSKTSIVRPEPLNYNLINGVWSPALQKIFYNYMTNTAKYRFSTHHDLLGYVDKDVEKAFTAVVSDKSGKTINKTMLNFNAWEDIVE